MRIGGGREGSVDTNIPTQKTKKMRGHLEILGGYEFPE